MIELIFKHVLILSVRIDSNMNVKCYNKLS